MSLHHGDCLEVMAGMDRDVVDAIVTDPPYDLLSTGARNGSRRINNPDNPAGRSARGFMGKAWDGTGIAFRPETWAAAYRVAKPSAYLLAFGGTRTVHRMAVAIEDAGWIIRDMLVWAYASGFPKSKASLKPAWEPIVMARKPGPLRMLAIDECRIAIPPGDQVAGGTFSANGRGEAVDYGPGGYDGHISRRGEPSAARRYADAPGDFAAAPGPRGGDPLGRWPANVILTDDLFSGDTPGVVGGGWQSGGGNPPRRLSDSDGVTLGTGWPLGETGKLPVDTEGSYSRFFLIPKADRADREPVLGGPTSRVVSVWGGDEDDLTPGKKSTIARRNHHPTVKPVDLMRHLVRLVTPTGGTVLDPFLGSGTTALAAEMEGFEWIGIEREAEYVAIAEARLNGTQRGLGLPFVS